MAGDLEAVASDLTLVVSELITNSVHAGRQAQNGQIAFRMSLTPTDRLIRIEVTDPFPGRPTRQHAAETDLHGRGLLIVGALSEDMGCRHEPNGGKTTWATLRA